MRFFTSVITLTLMLMLQPAYAQENNASAAAAKIQQTPCSTDILDNHTYKMMEMTETPPRDEDLSSRNFPFRYLYFAPKNRYQTLITDHEFTSAARLTTIIKALDKQPRTYTLDKDGILNLMYDNKLQYSFRCVSVLNTVGKYHKGDMVLSGYTRKGITLLYELYRLWY